MLSVVLVAKAKLLSMQHKQIFVIVNIRAASLFHIPFFVLFLINCYLTLLCGFFSSCSEHGLLCSWHRLLIAVASPVVERGL